MSVPPLIAATPGKASGSLLNRITETSQSVPLFAAASGGGGGGTGNFSNINIAVGGQITFSNDNTWDSQGLAWATDATATSTITIQPNYVQNEASEQTVGLGVLLNRPDGAGYQNLGVNSLYLNTGYGSLPGAVIMNDPTNNGTAYVSSMRVSSINGGAVAVTSGAVADVKQIFDALFAANPSLTPVSY